MPALGLGRGATDFELSARLRYRIAEPFAPYVGISHTRLIGRTADLARLAGDGPKRPTSCSGYAPTSEAQWQPFRSRRSSQ